MAHLRVQHMEAWCVRYLSNQVSLFQLVQRNVLLAQPTFSTARSSADIAQPTNVQVVLMQSLDLVSSPALSSKPKPSTILMWSWMMRLVKPTSTDMVQHDLPTAHLRMQRVKATAKPNGAHLRMKLHAVNRINPALRHQVHNGIHTTATTTNPTIRAGQTVNGMTGIDDRETTHGRTVVGVIQMITTTYYTTTMQRSIGHTFGCVHGTSLQPLLEQQRRDVSGTPSGVRTMYH